MLVHRSSVCDVCGGVQLMVKHGFVGGGNEVYEERCLVCKNLLYGFVRSFVGVKCN